MFGSADLVAFLETQVPLVTLLILMCIDIAFGLVAAYGAKQLNSAYTWQGITKKAGVVAIIGAVSVLQASAQRMGVPVEGVPASGAITIFYCLWEILSITENAARCGAPVPKALKEALAKARGPSVADAQKVEITNTAENPVPVAQGEGDSVKRNAGP